MIGEALQIIKFIGSPAIKGTRWSIKEGRQLWFRLRDKKPPLDETSALNVAYSYLGGSIASAISYRNINSKHTFIAAVHRESDEAFEFEVSVLERIGRAYIKIWNSQSFGGLDPASFNVIDINRDGVKEIVFEQSGFGSGAGTKSFYVYSTDKRTLYEITEYYNYSDATSPRACLIELNVGDDEKFASAITDYATTRGFLGEAEPVDFDKPEYAIERWHKENGAKRTGVVKVHFFEGEPSFGSSMAGKLDTPDITWISVFKGPLYGYVKSKNQHFIAYSPAWVYEWINAMAFDGHLLWCGIHTRAGLFSFDPGTNHLNHYISYDNHALPRAEEISFADGILILNDEIGLPTNDLSRFETCASYCRLTEPHIRQSCSAKLPDLTDLISSNEL
jgi:hypothetical protein